MKNIFGLILLISTYASTAEAVERCRVGRDRSMSCGAGYALFEFAPTSGAGMGTACACAAVTGAKGEAMTFTRASDGSCMKGGEFTGIANGDLVTCSSNQPRIMPGDDGTGGLGLSRWMARTNSTIRSEEFDNAAWSTLAGGVAAPTVTADQAVAPDGTTTADRVQFPATGLTQYSAIRNTGCAATSHATGSVFVKGVSGSGTLEIGGTDGATVYYFASVAFNSTTWTRIHKDDFATGASAQPLYIGNVGWSSGAPGNFGTVTRSAADVYLWGAQCEIGEMPSPYIKTAGTAATRVAEVATFAVTIPSVTTGSMFGTYAGTVTSGTGDRGLVTLQNAGSYTLLPDLRTTTGLLTVYSTTGSYTGLGGLSSSGQHRFGVFWTGGGTSSTFSYDGVNQGTGSAQPGASNQIEIGGYSAGQPANMVIKKVCYDTDSTRCR